MIIAGQKPHRGWLRTVGLGAALIALSAATGWGAARLSHHAATPDIASVREALKLRLPKTQIDAIKCASLGGLCEVASKSTLFYVDPTAKYLVIGRVYDMEARQDLTAARLLALNPDLLAAGAVRRPDVEKGATPQRTAAARVSVTELDPKGAVHWGPETGSKVVVFSDFKCGYCKKLEGELKAIGARVEERPISIFGAESRKLSERVVCAPNPAAALVRAYAGQSLPESKACDTSGLDANAVFAKRHGFGGTPVLVRPADGAVIEGFRPAAELKAWLTAPLSPVTKGQ